MMNTNRWWMGQSRRGWLALLAVMVCLMGVGHGHVGAADNPIWGKDDAVIVDGVRGRMFTVGQNTIVTTSTKTGQIINDNLFTLYNNTAYLAFDHQRNWLLIDELVRITLLNADTGEIIYQLEGTFDEGDRRVARPQIDSELGIAWLFRSGFVDDVGNNTQPARVIAMNLLNGEHLQERRQAMMYGDGQLSHFLDSYYDSTTHRIHYTYWTTLNETASNGLLIKQQHVVTLDAVSLNEVSRATMPYSDGDSYPSGGPRVYWGVVYGGRLHGISSGERQVPTLSWSWDGWTMTSNDNEPATIGMEARGIVADIQRGLIVEADEANFFVREGGTRQLIHTFNTRTFMGSEPYNYFRLVGHDPITDNVILVVNRSGNVQVEVRPMHDLLAQPEVEPPNPSFSECVIPPSGPWPPCVTGGGGNTPPPATGNECVIPASGPWPPCAAGAGGSPSPTPPANDDDCVIPESGPWPPCATGGG